MFKNNLTIFSLFSEITYAFKPDAIVVQCGADCLSNDPLGKVSNKMSVVTIFGCKNLELRFHQ